MSPRRENFMWSTVNWCYFFFIFQSHAFCGSWLKCCINEVKDPAEIPVWEGGECERGTPRGRSPASTWSREPPTTTESVRSSNSGLASEILHGEMVISSSRLQWLLLTTRNLEHLRTRGTTATTRRRLSLTRSRCPRRSLARRRRGWRRGPGSGAATPTCLTPRPGRWFYWNTEKNNALKNFEGNYNWLELYKRNIILSGLDGRIIIVYK